MKKLGGIILGLVGAGLAAVGVAAAVKSGKQDNYVDVTDSYSEVCEDEEACVENSEE